MSKYIYILSFFCWAVLGACSDDTGDPPVVDEPAEPMIISLSANGIEAVKAGEATYIVKLPYDTDLSAVALSTETSGTLTVGGAVLAHEAVVDLTRPLTMTVKTSAELARDFSVAVRFTDLPVVYVDTPETVTSKENWVKNSTMSIFTDTADVVALQKVQCKGRGNTTWGYPKKPYALKLDSKTSVLGMPKHKRWVLLANYLDKTQMRNDVAFKVGQLMSGGLGWTPRGRFVDLVFNGRYVGNYYLCEQIKVDKNRVDIAEIEPDDLEGDALTGGYLLEYDTYFDEVNKFRSELRRMPVNIKEPDEDILAPAHLDYIKDYINGLERTLAGDFTFEDLTALIDVDSFVDWWIANELVGNYEPAHPKSTYMHKDRGGKLCAGPLWDFDYATFLPGLTEWLIKESVYYGDLFRNPGFVARVKERWLLHKPALETVPDYIASTYASISQSVEINQLLWPTPESPNDEGSLSCRAAVDRLTLAYTLRLQWMDSQITGW